LTQEDEAQMRASLATRLGDEDRLHIEYALGRRAEDAGDIGNRSRITKPEQRLPAGGRMARCPTMSPELDRTRDVFTPAFLGERADWGDPDPRRSSSSACRGRVRRWSNRFWRAMATLKGQWNCPSFQRLPDKSRKQEALPRSIA
jgi:hypothetical protein